MFKCSNSTIFTHARAIRVYFCSINNSFLITLQ